MTREQWIDLFICYAALIASGLVFAYARDAVRWIQRRRNDYRG